jgi:hypothetical protein
MKASTQALAALRSEAAALAEAAAEGERLASLNSEMRLITIGSDSLRQEHARLSPLAAQAQVGGQAAIRRATAVVSEWTVLP